MKILNLILVTLFCSNIFAQTTLTKKQKLDSLPNTVENQFIKTYGKASNWQQYKMITRTDFQALQKNIVDSVVALKKTIQNKELKINEQEKNVSDLNNKITSLTNKLNSSINKENKINFIGIGMTKNSYNLLLWSIITVLAIATLFFFMRFKNSNSLTKAAKSNLAEIEEEFETHRRKSLEKEQKLRRQLQDEINKQRGV
ncbi:tRNA (guanine-N1)-methyltransferase [Tenacibaculum sp. MEBiC06402]|uniref:tRNA (guanine-N1)-methyltransferase n=1 Tax=unclassified Tenacibaculum TaxID=2635139 RepID=UPI003B9D2580